jgi:hypothetical protein
LEEQQLEEVIEVEDDDLSPELPTIRFSQLNKALMRAQLKKKRQLLALQDPTTSDLEEKIAEPTHTTFGFVQTVIKIFVNTKMANQKPLPPIPLSSFSLIDVETALSAEVDELVEDEDYKVY